MDLEGTDKLCHPANWGATSENTRQLYIFQLILSSSLVIMYLDIFVYSDIDQEFNVLLWSSLMVADSG